MGQQAITFINRKQGMNTKNSTEAEYIAVDEVIDPMFWIKRFLKLKDIT